MRTTMPWLAAIAMLVGAAPAHAENWPQFRGRQACGVGDGATPTEWDVATGKNVKWRVDVPGLAHSSPVVWEKLVFLTTAIPDAAGTPELTKGWEAADGHSAADTGAWTFKVLCFDRDTGRLLWESTAHQGLPRVKRHPKSTHANCTPTTDGKSIVTFFGAEGLYCHDFTGKLLWKKDLGMLNSSPTQDAALQWGFASSPIIHDNLVIVQCDCENTNFWAAFDLRTGDEVRRVARDEDTTWSTPSVFEIDGAPQLVLNGYKHMGAYDLRSGAELWRLGGGGDVPVPAPIFAHGLVFLTNGHGASKPIYAIDPTSRGDITPKKDADHPGIAWWVDRKGSYMPTPIAYGDNLYVGDDSGILTAYAARTGETRFRTRIAGGGANYTASPVAADGKLYFTSEDGDVHVIQAGDEYALLATNPMNEICMATPAISKGMIFIRTKSRLYCIGE